MNVPAPLEAGNAVLLLIDYQERLFPAMHDKENLLRSVLKLIRGALVLEVPVIVTEQYPRGLGPTLPEIRELLPAVMPIEKLCFSCCDSPEFTTALGALKRKQVLAAGIEAHICVYQTALGLARAGYDVRPVADAVASRDPENKLAALTKLGAAGLSAATVEMALFEMLKAAGTDKFKQISAIVK